MGELILYYALAIWGGMILFWCAGLTAMVSRYARRVSEDPDRAAWIDAFFVPKSRAPSAFDIYFWCAVVGLFSVLWLALARLT